MTDAPGARRPPRRPGSVVGLLRRDLGTVRARTTAAATAVVGLALVLTGFGLVALLHDRLDEQAAVAAASRADEVVAALRSGAAPDQLTSGSADDRLVQVLDASGRLVAASPNARGRPLAQGPAGSGPVAGGPVRLAHPLADGGDFVVAARAADLPGARLTVLAGVSLEDPADSAHLTAGLLAVGIPLILLVVAVTTWRVVGRALAPVEAMRAEVDAISASALHRRVAPAVGDDEIGRLAATMNRMLARLEQAQQRQRRFVSDASHELRSPVASIRQHAEVALSHPGRTTVPELAETVLVEDGRIQRLVDDLVLLARADENGAGTGPQPVDLDDLVLAVAARVRAAGRVAVDLSGVGAGRVDGDRQLLERVVGNLVDNAARHAASRLALSLAHDEAAGVVVLRVDDDGPGVPDADRERVFERFVRLDEARDRDSGGSGLGLAIAAEVVRAYGGRICAGRSDLGGARFEVVLPASDG